MGNRRPQDSAAACEMLVEREEDDEWDDRHIQRREDLVRSFMISWDNGKAEWLPFPGTKSMPIQQSNPFLSSPSSNKNKNPDSDVWNFILFLS
jgi:hypothetical protein